MSKELEEKIEEVKGLVVGIQTENEAKSKLYGEKGAENDVSIKAMETKLGELSESIQAENDANAAVKKATEDQINELTLAVARGAGESKSINPADMEMSDEVKGQLSQALRETKGTYAIDKAVANTIVTDHVKQTFGHMTEAKQEVLVKSILAEGSSPAGGMWCPVPIDSRIRTRVFETSPLGQMAETINVNTQAMTFALDDEELLVAQASEVDFRGETGTPEFGEVRIDTHELFAKPKATLQVLEDSTLNLESWLSGKVATKMARDRNAAFIIGNGEKTARGILDYADTGYEVYARNKLGTGETAAALTISGDDLIDLQSHLLEDYQSNAAFLMHRLIWAKVTKLKDTNGAYLLNPAQLFQGSSLQLLGAPVRMAGDMPKPNGAGVLTSGQTYVTYGDFREGYTILERLGINVIMDNITQSGFVKWYFRSRYGAAVTNFQAIKRLKAQ